MNKIIERLRHSIVTNYYVIRNWLYWDFKVICQDQKDYNTELRNLRHDLMLNGDAQEFVDSLMRPSRSNRLSSAILPQGMAFLRNSDAFEAVSISGLCWELNIHSTGYWWNLAWLDTSGKWSCVYTVSHVIAADVTLAKQQDVYKYTLRSTNKMCPISALKITISPSCLRRRTHNISEWIKGLEDWNGDRD
jgi:hypothetical protein